MTKTFIIGLDGAHWELLDPWIDSGELPTLARIRKESVWGDLESCLPPVTCPNWKCSTTGKNPGKLGAFWWERVDIGQRKITTVNANTFSTPEIWDYLNVHDLSTAVVNMPTTYPPRAIDGCMIAGGPDAESDGYTYPESLQSDLEAEYNYRLRPTDVGLLPNNKERIAKNILDLIDMRFDVALDLAEDHDFVQVTVFYINVLQHFFWRDPLVKRAWKCIDDNLARVIDHDANVIVHSDHGSNEIDHVFNINAWLEREGYLVLERGTPDVLSRLGITAENAKHLLSLCGPGWYSHIKNLIPGAISELIPTNSGGVKRAGKADKIDWDASTAVAGGQGPIYLLTDNESVRKQLTADLEAISHPVTGRKPVRQAYRGKDVYHGDQMADAPAILLDQSRGWHIAGEVGIDTVFNTPDRWAAENKRTGLFAMHGPAFSNDGTPDDLSILDLAPTLLHLHGLPIPESLDGTVSRDLFAPDTGLRERDPEYVPEYGQRDESDAMLSTDGRDRLKDLGYL